MRWPLLSLLAVSAASHAADLALPLPTGDGATIPLDGLTWPAAVVYAVWALARWRPTLRVQLVQGEHPVRVQVEREVEVTREVVRPGV